MEAIGGAFASDLSELMDGEARRPVGVRAHPPDGRHRRQRDPGAQQPARLPARAGERLRSGARRRGLSSSRSETALQVDHDLADGALLDRVVGLGDLLEGETVDRQRGQRARGHGRGGALDRGLQLPRRHRVEQHEAQREIGAISCRTGTCATLESVAA